MIATQTPIVMEALHVVATTVEEITPHRVVTGLVLPIVAKVRANSKSRRFPDLWNIVKMWKIISHCHLFFIIL